MYLFILYDFRTTAVKSSQNYAVEISEIEMFYFKYLSHTTLPDLFMFILNKTSLYVNYATIYCVIVPL